MRHLGHVASGSVSKHVESAVTDRVAQFVSENAGLIRQYFLRRNDSVVFQEYVRLIPLGNLEGIAQLSRRLGQIPRQLILVILEDLLLILVLCKDILLQKSLVLHVELRLFSLVVLNDHVLGHLVLPVRNYRAELPL